MQDIQTFIARALVRLAIWAAPAEQADQLRDADRLIWRPQVAE